MSSAITSQGRTAAQPVVAGVPECPFCKQKEYLVAETIQMTNVKAVFECVACGLFRIVRIEEMGIWSKMKGRLAPTPPISLSITMDPEVVARSTNIVNQ
jgi:Zn ribbon nucleic-acid-binding protein